MKKGIHVQMDGNWELITWRDVGLYCLSGLIIAIIMWALVSLVILIF